MNNLLTKFENDLDLYDDIETSVDVLFNENFAQAMSDLDGVPTFV